MLIVNYPCYVLCFFVFFCHSLLLFLLLLVYKKAAAYVAIANMLESLPLNCPFRSTQTLRRSGKKLKQKQKEFLATTRYANYTMFFQGETG